MAARVATWFAIVIGGTGGTLAALAGSGSTTASAPAASMQRMPSAEVATQVQAATPASAPVPSALTPAASTSAAPTLAPASDASAAAVPAVGASARPNAPLPEAELLPLPTTKEALLRQEVRCDQRQAEACIVAARSYEGGVAGTTDPEKAARYRRIALTAWISQCDHNSAAACATLATMYRTGSGVPQSDRNADALVARARELCRFNDAPACHDLPAP